MSAFWQAPGNAKGFDSYLGDNSKMNNRTIGVLSYIKESSLVDGFVSQLDNTTYPNSATKKVKELKLFPFRILFKLLLDNTSFSSKFINHSLVHVKSYEDLKEYENFKDLSKIAYFSADSAKYLKFNTWVINSLVSLNILTLSNKQLSIRNDIQEHIEVLYANTNFTDMFFDSTTCDVNKQIAHKRVQRDSNLILLAKKRDSSTCRVDKTHKTFLSKGNNYVEGHHIIPMFQQKNYSFRLDDIDNIISLCPTYHREIHSADDKTEILKKLYNLNREYMNLHHISLNNLFSMYLCE